VKKEAECCATRQRYWSELTDSEKIERMRQHVKILENQIGGIHAVHQGLLRHQHNISGQMVTLFEPHRGTVGEALGRRENPDEVYF